MSNITLSVNDDVIRKVRRLAAAQNTSLNAIVRSNLQQLATREDLRTAQLIGRLKESFDTAKVELGRKSWTREELHAR